MLSSIRLTALILAFVGMNPALAAGIDWSKVEAALGRQAAVLPGDVHRFGMPRGDLEVTLGHVTIRPALALGAWAAFHPAGDNDAMVMGDLVVTDAEVAPVMKALREGGVAVTALHNHLVGERPKIMYIHMGGHGDPVAMARTIKTAVELTGTPPPAASVAAEPAELGFDAGAVEAILGRAGSVSGGVLHIGVPRAETLRVDGMTVPPSMGAGTAINFQPLRDGRVVAYGDFALTGPEVATAMATLSAHGIETMALHNHMLGDEPRLFYIHFWGVDDALALARGLKAALGETNAATAADPEAPVAAAR